MTLEKKNTHSKHAFVFRVACPSCGAPVRLQSATSLIAVCSYCTATLIRQDNQLIDSGKKSAILKDYSLIQIGTVGTFEKKTFSVIGLWQVVYDNGFWNEWYILFENGLTGWLAEFNGLYTITIPTTEVIKGIIFAKITAGFSRYRGFLAADIRTMPSIQCNAQGELPFLSQNRNQSTLRLADFRKKNQFITLDFDADNSAKLYRGKMVLASALNLKNTRSNLQIKESAGHLRGRPLSFSCPQCAYSLKWYPGIAEIVYCTACTSEVHLSSEKMTLTQAHSKQVNLQNKTTLKLGTVLPLHNKKWTIIGIIKYLEFKFDNTLSKQAIQQTLKHRKQHSSSNYWYEYLLYRPSEPFLFLSETVCANDVEWQISYTKTLWPTLGQNHHITSEKGKFIVPSTSYIGQVDFAIGAFNWQVSQGDQIFCHNYKRYTDNETDGTSLTVEISPHEISFSASRYLNPDELKACRIKNSTYVPYQITCDIIFLVFLVFNFLLIVIHKEGAPEFELIFFIEAGIFMHLIKYFLGIKFLKGIISDYDED